MDLTGIMVSKGNHPQDSLISGDWISIIYPGTCNEILGLFLVTRGHLEPWPWLMTDVSMCRCKLVDFTPLHVITPLCLLGFSNSFMREKHRKTWWAKAFAVVQHARWWISSVYTTETSNTSDHPYWPHIIPFPSKTPHLDPFGSPKMKKSCMI